MSGSRIASNAQKLRITASRPTARTGNSGSGNDYRTDGGGGGSGGGGGGSGGGGGGWGGGGGIELHNGNQWDLFKPHNIDRCFEETCEGFVWTILNSAKLSSGGDWGEQVAPLQTKTMCELRGGILADFLLRRLQDFDEQWILERMTTEEGIRAVVAKVDSAQRSYQDSEAEAQARARNAE